jgi:D-aspartate ligase
MAKISVLIPDGESTLTKHVVHCLSVDTDIKVHILSKDPKANIRHSRFISSFKSYDQAHTVPPPQAGETDKELAELIRFHHYDPSLKDEVTDSILHRAKEVNADVIFPVDEHIIRILTSSADKINAVSKLPPLPDYDTFVVAIDKWKLARFLEQHNIAHPRTLKYNADTTDDELRALKFPVIIKPTNQGNALGIELFQDADKLLAFLHKQNLRHEYIIQPYIKGYDIDCSLLALNGKILAYTIQKGIVFSEVKFRAAVGIEFVFEQKVIDIVEKMMKLMNWSGVAHIDLRYDEVEDMPQVLEINARYWGSLLGSKNAGVNFPLLHLKTMNNEPFGKPEYKLNRYFMGKSPIAKILKSDVRLFETSLPYSLRDPMPAFFDILAKLSKF